jgi:hypothetical protein
MQALEKYTPSDRDTWTWYLAKLEDVQEIVDLASGNFQHEVDAYMTVDLPLFARNLALTAVKQMYSLYDEQLLIARHKTDNYLMGWAWAGRGSYTTYSRDEMAEGKFVHMNLELASRVRVTMLAQVLQHWYNWAVACSCPVLVSTTIRGDQRAFLHLHQQAGFELKGSIGYMRITPK